jgi:glycosyltransferase involved in cell wall biosynthesis
VATSPNTTGRMRILVVAPRLPYPPRGGVDLRVLQAVNGGAAAGPVAVFGVRSEPAPAPPDLGIEVWRCSGDASLSDLPARGAATLRWLRDGVGHPYDRYLTDSTAVELEALVEEFRPDAAVVETLTLHRYVEFLKRRGLPVALDAHDVETAVQRSIVESLGGAGGVPSLVASRLAKALELVERAAFRTAHQIWACSHCDAGLVRSLFPGSAPVEIIPNTIAVERYAESSASAARNRHSIVFPGSFAYPPNAQAALWLARDMLPRVLRRFPDALLELVGTTPTAEMLAAASENARITVTGAVPDVRPHLAGASVMAAPIFVGGGTRLKVLEAFASRLPVVSTAKGVEGLDVRAGQHYLAAETAEAFVSAVGALWSHPAVARGLTERALALVRESYSWSISARRIQDALARLRTPARAG